MFEGSSSHLNGNDWDHDLDQIRLGTSGPPLKNDVELTGGEVNGTPESSDLKLYQGTSGGIIKSSEKDVCYTGRSRDCPSSVVVEFVKTHCSVKSKVPVERVTTSRPQDPTLFPESRLLLPWKGRVYLSKINGNKPTEYRPETTLRLQPMESSRHSTILLSLVDDILTLPRLPP